jgi:hypothetical protein
VGALYAVLRTCPEPEIVAEAAALKAVLEDPSALAWLRSVGLKVDPRLLGKDSNLVVAREEMEAIVVGRRNRSNSVRAISVEHAAAVATRLGLQAGRHGDIQRLAHAIRLDNH